MPIGLPPETEVSSFEPLGPDEAVSLIVAAAGPGGAIALLRGIYEHVREHRCVIVVNGLPAPAAEYLAETAAQVSAGQCRLVGSKSIASWPAALEAARMLDAQLPGVRAVIVWHEDHLAAGNWPRMLLPLAHPRVGVVTSAIVGQEQLQLPIDRSESWAAFSSTPRPPQADGDPVSGAPMAISLDALEFIGGQIFGSEYSPIGYGDWDLWERMLAAEFYVGSVGDVSTFHWQQDLAGNLWPGEEYLWRNQELYLKKWPNGLWRRRALA